jgi:hypothetical protein
MERRAVRTDNDRANSSALTQEAGVMFYLNLPGSMLLEDVGRRQAEIREQFGDPRRTSPVRPKRERPVIQRAARRVWRALAGPSAATH